jgi:oligoribonuclease
MSKARTILFWLDFESTGLDVRKGHGELLEFAVVFTDLELSELGCDEGVIPHKIDYIDSILQDRAREMHIANHLLDDLRSIQDSSWCFGEEAVRFIEDQLILKLKKYLEEDPKTIFVIAGSSISFDRDALREHMPRLEKMLHYRQLDVSVYKVGFPHIFGESTSTAHRAMADIRESIKKHAKMREIVGHYEELRLDS